MSSRRMVSEWTNAVGSVGSIISTGVWLRVLSPIVRRRPPQGSGNDQQKS